MIGNFIDSFGGEIDDRHSLPQEIIDMLNSMLPENFMYIKDESGHYKAVPKPEKLKEGIELTTQFDLDKVPELKEKLNTVPREKWDEYLYRTQQCIPIKNAKIGDKNKQIPIELLSHDPLMDEEARYIDGWMKPEPFPEPIMTTYESPEGDVVKIGLQQQAYDSFTEVKFTSVGFPALKIELYQYSPLVDVDSEDVHTSEMNQIVVTYSVKPTNAESVRDAVAALHIFRGLQNGTTKVNGHDISPEGGIGEPKQVEEALQFWETAQKLEEKLRVSFNPASEFPSEDIRLFNELQTCLLDNKEIVWRHPFDHFHVGGIHPIKGNVKLEDYIGKDSFRYEFIEGPILVRLLGAEFNLYSRTRMEDFIMTNIVWDDESKEAGEVYISDGPERQWRLTRQYITAADMKPT